MSKRAEALAAEVLQLGMPELERFARSAAAELSKRAERVYQADPENNGEEAQVLADLTALFEDMVLAVNPGYEDEEFEADNARPTTVAEALEERDNPWNRW